MFDDLGNLYEISLPATHGDIELDGYMLSEYESAIANIATRFLDMKADPNNHPTGKQC